MKLQILFTDYQQLTNRIIQKKYNMSYKRREHVLTTNKSAIDTYLTVNSTPLYSSL